MPPLPIPPPNRPPPLLPTARKPVGLTREFLQNPLLFMRTHAVSPPDDSGWKEDVGRGVPLPPPRPGVEPDLPDMGVERRDRAGGIRWVKLAKHTSVQFPDAVALNVAPPTVVGDGPSGFNTDGSWLPIYWLPWKSLKLMSYKIPEFPSNLVDDDDEQYPRFFFTAGINGCSVFAQGDARSPVITHGGITGGSTGGDAGEFWRRQMAKTRSGWAASKIKGEINADDYSMRSVLANKLADDYAKFLTDPSKKNFSIETQSPFGCVFGIRYGRMWSLYLQRSSVFRKVQFFKTSELDFRENGVVTSAYVKGTDTFVANRDPKMFTAGRTFGPLKVGKDVDTKVYSRTLTTFCKPLQLLDFYPKKGFIADLRSIVTGG